MRKVRWKRETRGGTMSRYRAMYTVYRIWTRTARKCLANLANLANIHRNWATKVSEKFLSSLVESGRPTVPTETEHLGLTTVHGMLLSRKELLS